MPRYLSLDILRGVAILLMVQVHFVGHLSPYEESSAWLYYASSWLGMVPAPLFTFVAGMSFCLWTRKQEALGKTNEAITKVALRRGLFLFGTGLALNFFVWLPEEIFNWDILTLIGASFLILPYASKLPSEVLVLICVIVLLLCPPLRVLSDYADSWKGESYEPDFTLTDSISGFFLNGYFPLLPWIIFPLLGFLIADVVYSRTKPSTTQIRWLAITGLGLMTWTALSLMVGTRLPAVIAKHYASGFTLYPASTEYLCGTLGLSMFSFALLHGWLDREIPNSNPGFWVRFWQRWSGFSLTIYLVHLAIHLWPLWLYGVWKGKEDPTYYWQNAMSTPAALGLALAFIVICSFALVLLDRHKKYSLESLMRWLCD